MEKLLHLFDLTPTDVAAIPFAMLWFYVLYRCLKGLVFEPYLKLEALRDGATTGAVHDAKVLQQKAQQLNAETERELKTTRDQALAKRSEHLTAVTKEAEHIQAQAETEASAIETREQQAIAEEMKQLEQSLSQESNALAGLVKNRIAELVN